MRLLTKLIYAAALAGVGAFTLTSAASAQSLSATDMTAGGQDAIFAKLANLKSVVAAGKGKIAVLLPDTRSSSRWGSSGSRSGSPATPRRPGR